MSEKRIVVWVQHFADRPYLMLQWHDEKGKRKSKSAETCNPKDAEIKRADLEADLNAGRYQEASRMTWEHFRQLFEEEYASGCRQSTRRNFADTFNLLERLCSPRLLRAVNRDMVWAFTAAMRKQPGRKKGSEGMLPSTITVRLRFLHIALQWAVKRKLLPELPIHPGRPPRSCRAGSPMGLLARAGRLQSSIDYCER
jgi:hypothetical protein